MSNTIYSGQNKKSVTIYSVLFKFNHHKKWQFIKLEKEMVQ